MNRRGFLESLLQAGIAFSILPPALTYQRVWRAERQPLVLCCFGEQDRDKFYAMGPDGTWRFIADGMTIRDNDFAFKVVREFASPGQVINGVEIWNERRNKFLARRIA